MNRESILEMMPSTVKDARFASIDMDFTGLTIPDILRNINTSYPKSSRDRNAIASGDLVICVLAKSKLMAPYRGLVFLITNDKTEIDVTSQRYMIFVADESSISEDDDITHLMDRLLTYLTKYSKDEIQHLQDLYAQFIYDPHEQEIGEKELFGDTDY